MLAALALVPVVGYLEAVACCCSRARLAAGAERYAGLRSRARDYVARRHCWPRALVPDRKKLVLVVIDGLTPSVFEDAVEDGTAPALTLLAEHGSTAAAISAFPSLTPVCLSSIATGAHPDVHHIPHLVWYHRGERRIVEYGSSFARHPRGGDRAARSSTRSST